MGVGGDEIQHQNMKNKNHPFQLLNITFNENYKRSSEIVVNWENPRKWRRHPNESLIGNVVVSILFGLAIILLDVLSHDKASISQFPDIGNVVVLSDIHSTDGSHHEHETASDYTHFWSWSWSDPPTQRALRDGDGNGFKSSELDAALNGRPQR